MEVEAELSEYKAKDKTVDELRQTLKGTRSQRTTQYNKGKDVTSLDIRIKELEAQIQKKLSENG